MKTEVAISYYGSPSKLAKALGITPQAVDQWGETVPVGRAYQLQIITNGDLQASDDSDDMVTDYPDGTKKITA